MAIGETKRGGRPRNTAGDPQVPIVGERVRAAVALRQMSVREMAGELQLARMATVSPTVLHSIAAGKQKTCRRSVRDAIARYVGWPVTREWLSGDPQPEAMRDAGPHLYLETLRTAQALVQATLSHRRMLRGDDRHLREVWDEEQERDIDSNTLADAVSLAIRAVYPALSWLSWRAALSNVPYRFPHHKVVEIAADDGTAWEVQEYRAIIEASYAHWAGQAIRLLVDNGAAPLDPALLQKASSWISEHVPIPSRVKKGSFLEGEYHTEPSEEEKATVAAMKREILARYRRALEIGAERFSPGKDSQSVIDRFVRERGQELAKFTTIQQLKAHMVGWQSSMGPVDAELRSTLELAARGRPNVNQPREDAEPTASLQRRSGGTSQRVDRADQSNRGRSRKPRK